MKYFLIILLSFVFVHPALAAKSVAGTVPTVLPFDRPDPSVHPNFGTNIEYTDPLRPPQVTPSGLVQPGQAGFKTASTSNQPPVSKNKAGTVWLWVILAVLVLGGGLLWLNRKKIFNEKT